MILRSFEKWKARFGTRRWAVAVLAAVLALTSVLQIGLIKNGPMHGTERYMVLDQASSGTFGQYAPGGHPSGQHDYGQLAGCTAGGCGLCGVVQMTSPMPQKVAGRTARAGPTGSLVSLAIVPPLPPPILHA